MPPRKAMSLPARSGTCRSLTADVRVNRGSTWMTLAPRAFASITHWNPTGWHSAMFEPWMTMQSECCRSCRKVEVLRVRRERAAVADLRDAARAVHELLARRALRTQPATRDGRARVAFDLDDLLVLDVDLLATANGAVRADAVDDAVGRFRPRL